MLVTLTNTSGAAMNGLDTFSSGVGVGAVAATGGSRAKPLPYPFGHIGSLANSGTKQLAVHPRDWHHKDAQGGSPLEAGEEWNILVQAGKVTLAVAAQATRRDSEELFAAAI